MHNPQIVLSVQQVAMVWKEGAEREVIMSFHFFLALVYYMLVAAFFFLCNSTLLVLFVLLAQFNTEVKRPTAHTPYSSWFTFNFILITRLFFLADCSQAILNRNWFWSYTNPALDDRLEQVVCPFQIENAEDKMDWNEKELPEEYSSCQFNFFFPQMEEEEQDTWVEVAANCKPSKVKESRDSRCNNRWNLCVTTRAVIVSVYQPPRNQEPCVQLDRQNSPHQPSITRVIDWCQQIYHGDNMMLLLYRIKQNWNIRFRWLWQSKPQANVQLFDFSLSSFILFLNRMVWNYVPWQ